jgi:hypothetical protein
MAGRRDVGARPVMSASPPRVMSGDVALLYVLEATVEILKAENESLKRQLAAAESRAAWAAIVERLAAPAADRLDALAAKRLDAPAIERTGPWWRRLAG